MNAIVLERDNKSIFYLCDVQCFIYCVVIRISFKLHSMLERKYLTEIYILSEQWTYNWLNDNFVFKFAQTREKSGPGVGTIFDGK